ncbi:LysR family transcriptional regulator [Kribbella sp.]|uniref:LysR family transcriptional regulator n=1 Tax=Kribbella sp. TaxID=1871183 RepID=UPI002D45A5CF|nr:LysR substrate-binding domain-containing protein [Kribbella sp.]HZX05638.1 LysR substrate-binding domain-containing protein [Kribbella sp.]
MSRNAIRSATPSAGGTNAVHANAVHRSRSWTVCAKLRSVIEVRRLRVLRALADHGTVTAAAEVLHLTPSAVSQQLAALETEVGQELLERRGRRVSITSAGRLLLAHADTILAEVERAEDAMRLHANGTNGEVRVTAFATAISLLVAPALTRLRETSPGLSLVVRDAEGHQGITQLLDGDADLAIAVEHRGSPRPDDHRLTRIPLYAEPFVAVLPPAHPAAASPFTPGAAASVTPPSANPGGAGAGGAGALELAALANDDWVMPAPGNPIRDVVLLACEQAGFQPRIVHQSDDFRAVAALVAAGGGVSLVPRLAVPEPTLALIRPLPDPAPTRRVYAAVRTSRADHPLITATLAVLTEVAEKL